MEWYDHATIEKKWQEKWERERPFCAEDFSKNKKDYVLVEFPYPSGDGLHVGHVRSYAALDAVARKKRMEGKNVLYPIGWDGFGLPTENYALKTGVHPRTATDANIANFRRQMKALGLSFDWSREIDTTDPTYYRWTQWIFLQILKKGLAYQATIPINWCPSCKIGLANEEVVSGKCERCGTEVTRRMQKQWMLKITAYADRLLKDLDTVHYLPKIKTQQVNWIGRSEGAQIEFEVKGEGLNISVFTTRPDTLFGATYLVLSPEHPLVGSVTADKQKKAVEKYLREAAKKSDLERTDLAKEKTGVFTGAFATNPVNNEKIPIWVADYVLASYGTGAIMAVPGHDERDNAFARKFHLPILQVIQPPAIAPIPGYEQTVGAAAGTVTKGILSTCWTGDGIMMNSGSYTGRDNQEAGRAILASLQERRMGKAAVQYKLRDWIFSRQHYWGEPIPIVHCPKHGIVPIPEKDLPVELPYVEKYQPTDTGESPLANVAEWVNTKCPMCGKPAKRETDTMPNWAGSSWYFLRYCDPNNDHEFAHPEKLRYWMPVDLYNGGMEHTVLHLLYSRFWYKVLADAGLVPGSEPYTHRHSHGMVLAEDGKKMSKSLGNVINPDDLIREYGADSLRVYEMFMGPFEDTIPWSTRGMIGVHRFLQGIHDLVLHPNERMVSELTGGAATEKDLERKENETIKKVTEDLEGFRFNTVISTLMEYANLLRRSTTLRTTDTYTHALRSLLILLFPSAPHLASELWEKTIGGDISKEHWPTYDAAKLHADTVQIIIQVNGRVRAKLMLPADLPQSEVEARALQNENVRRFVPAKPKKVIIVPGRIVNIVI
ncbi:MAG: leucine--tRNA ligase [bacterium]